MPKVNDQRGKHWKEKHAKGAGPKTWLSTRKWADLRKTVLAAYRAAAGLRGVAAIVPFYEPGVAKRVGGRAKTLWLYLQVCEWEGLVRLEKVSDFNVGFFGITRVTILDTDAYNRKDPRLRLAGGVENPSLKKTIGVMWKSVGLEEGCVDSGVTILTYNSAVADRQKSVMIRAGAARAAKTSGVAEVASGDVSPSVTGVASGAGSVAVSGSSGAGPSPAPLSVAAPALQSFRLTAAKERLSRAELQLNAARAKVAQASAQAEFAKEMLAQASARLIATTAEQDGAAQEYVAAMREVADAV